MSWNDAGFLTVTGSVTCMLKNNSCILFHESCHLDRCACSHLLGVVDFSGENECAKKDLHISLPEKPVDSQNWELMSLFAWAGLGLAIGLTSLDTARGCKDWGALFIRKYFELVYLFTALVPSDTVCFAISPGNRRRTAVWISQEVMVDLWIEGNYINWEQVWVTSCFSGQAC